MKWSTRAARFYTQHSAAFAFFAVLAVGIYGFHQEGRINRELRASIQRDSVASARAARQDSILALNERAWQLYREEQTKEELRRIAERGREQRAIQDSIQRRASRIVCQHVGELRERIKAWAATQQDITTRTFRLSQATSVQEWITLMAESEANYSKLANLPAPINCTRAFPARAAK